MANETVQQRVRAQKLQMTQLFTKEGLCIPVTAVKIVEGELNAGDVVTVSAVSKGKGFAGAVKRYSFAGGPKTHGQSDRHRAVGSIGQGTFPGRVWKGKKMPGRMGNDRITIKNVVVVEVLEGGIVFLRGPLPGGRTTKINCLITARAVTARAVTAHAVMEEVAKVEE